MASAEQMLTLLTKIVNAVSIDEDNVVITFTDGTQLNVCREWNDYTEEYHLVTYYKNEQIESCYVVDHG